MRYKEDMMSSPVRNIISIVAVLCTSACLVSNAHATLEDGHIFHSSPGNMVNFDISDRSTGCGPSLPDRIRSIQSPG